MFDKRYLIIPILLFITASAGTEVLSQKLPFRVYSIEEGLSGSAVYDLHQDRDGYLWIATGYGLNRFDGRRMETYYRQDGLSGNQINRIAEDDSGRLWIGTDSGVSIMEGDTVRSPDYLEDLRRYSITAIYQDHHQDWWFGTDGAGVWLLDGNDELTQYNTVHGLAGNHVREIVQGENRGLWFATSGGLTNLNSGNFTTYTTEQGLPHNDLHTVVIDGEERLWIGTGGGLSVMAGDEFTNYNSDNGLVHNSVLSISVTENGEAWLGTEQGVTHFADSTMRSYTTEQGLSSNIIYSTLIDREGHIWFGTMGGGANIYLGEYFHNYTAEEGLTNDVVTDFDRDPAGHFWIATFGGGVMHYDGVESRSYSEADGLVDNRVFTVYSDPAGQTWVGTRNGISIIEDRQVKAPDERFRQLDMVRAFFEDRDTGDFWIGTHDDGIYHFMEDTMAVYDNANYLENNTVMSIQKDSLGRIWFATYGGIVIFDDEEFSRYTVEDGLPSNGVISIMFDDKGDAWISTLNGFARFDTETMEARTFTSSFGLSSTLTHFMFQDVNNHLWLGTNIGIIRFDYERYMSADSDIERDLSYELVDREQGLISNEMNSGAFYRDERETIWLGTVDGVSRFFPERLPDRQIPPKVHFEEIVIAGEADSPDQRTLSHERNFIEVELTGISFAAPSRVLFEYRLEGIDEGWTHSYNRSVRYPSLSPGEYSFRVRAYNSSGLRSPDTGSFNFEITPPFWMQWWFFALLSLFFIGIILFIYNYYRVRKLIEMERMRVQIASDLHDDVGASLTELALQTDFLRTEELEKPVEQTLKQIGEDSRRIVSTLDDIVWSIDARNDTAGDLTDRMQDHANNLLASKGVRLNFLFSDLEPDQQLPVQVKENLYLIFKESINNIAKHSNADEVDITLSLKGKRYFLHVADNGTVVTDGKKTGQGLHNIRMRAKRMNAEAIIDRDKGFNIKVAGALN